MTPPEFQALPSPSPLYVANPLPPPDANRPDAGKTVNRRFTEIWVRRNSGWEKIVHHASNILAP